VLITGARQTGKTTLSRATYPKRNYLNLDSVEIRDQIRHVRTDAWANTVGPAIIDEAQKEPSVFPRIKYAFDAGQVGFSVLLGSSQILMPFHRFQKLAALRSAQLLSYSELGRDAGLSTSTSRRYVEYLRLSYQAFLLPPTPPT